VCDEVSSFNECLHVCNEAARRKGIKERLFRLLDTEDRPIALKLTIEVCANLVLANALAVIAPSSNPDAFQWRHETLSILGSMAREAGDDTLAKCLSDEARDIVAHAAASDPNGGWTERTAVGRSLTAWLQHASKLIPALKGITAPALADESGDDIAGWTIRRGEKWTFPGGSAADAWSIFMALAHLGEFSEDEVWKRHARWVRSYDWKESDEWHLVPEMLGFSHDALLARDLWPSEERGLLDLLAACNQLAEERNLPDRLISLRTGGDCYVIAAIPTESVTRLVDASLVELDALPRRAARPFRNQSPTSGS
jgi:hypothetical protein